MTKTLQRVYQNWIKAIPPAPVKSVVEWCKRHVRLPGSARSEKFDPSITPWTSEPLECAGNGTRLMTHIKPVQGGGSVEGECAICYWIGTQSGGDIQYLWQSDDAADDRWSLRVEKILETCKPVMARKSEKKHQWVIGRVIFPHLNFIMEGVFSKRAVASKAICRQVNEEIHDWTPGRLEQAHGRLTAYWNSIAFQISNASLDGDQLHKIFLAGTQQHWQVKCPGCGLYHRMRTRWEEDHPELGGLRYDSEGCKRADGTYDYTKLQSSVRLQMPCGYIAHDDVSERRKLSLSGKYSDGDNDGALKTERSYTLEAVSIDYIPWITLIKQKHEALKSLDYGTDEPWSVYLRERECQFYKPGNRPVARNIVVSNRKKAREGLADRVVRLGSADYQQGEVSKGELPHWWHMIADVAIIGPKIHILIVSEGKITTDENLTNTFKDHELVPSCVILDSGWNATHVYQLCLTYGYYCVKGEDTELFSGHEDGGKKIYSPPKPIHAMRNQPPRFPYKMTKAGAIPDPQEPMFIRYSKYGLLEKVAWVRTSKTVEFEVPEDVSEDFKGHMDAWRLEKRKDPRTRKEVPQWVQRRDRDDLLMCLGYILIQMEDMGYIGAAIDIQVEVEVVNKTEGETK